MLLFIEHQITRIQPLIEDLKLEERATITNWLLFVVTTGISFGIISSGILPTIFIAAAPVIGWVTPSIIAYVNKQNRSPTKTPINNVKQEACSDDTKSDVNSESDRSSIDKFTGHSLSYLYSLYRSTLFMLTSIITDTKINSKSDDLWSATTKFILHTLSHYYILYQSSLIIVSSLHLAPVALIGLSCIVITGLILIPVLLKECIQLYLTAQKFSTTPSYRTKTFPMASLLKQRGIGITTALLAATAVFIGMCYLSQWAFTTTTIIPLSLIAFCPLLTAVITLFLVRYSIYIHFNKAHLSSCNTGDIIKNIISFSVLSIGSSWVLFKISCGVGVLQIGHLSSIGFLAAVTTTSLTLGFPMLIIFSCAAVLCLTHSSKREVNPEKSALLETLGTPTDDSLNRYVEPTSSSELSSLLNNEDKQRTAAKKTKNGQAEKTQDGQIDVHAHSVCN